MLFIDNKYTHWYYAIITNAQARTITGYTEKHHIIPKSIGGTNTKDNLVALTAREHFICHWLLTKITSGNDRYKMINALYMMRAENPNQQRYETKITAKVYDKIREQHAQFHSINMIGNKWNKGRIPWNKGKLCPTISIAKKGRPGHKHSEETKIKMSKPRTKEHCANISASRKGKPAHNKGKPSPLKGFKTGPKPKLECPHCGTHAAANTAKMFHFENCKKKAFH